MINSSLLQLWRYVCTPPKLNIYNHTHLQLQHDYLFKFSHPNCENLSKMSINEQLVHVYLKKNSFINNFPTFSFNLFPFFFVDRFSYIFIILIHKMLLFFLQFSWIFLNFYFLIAHVYSESENLLFVTRNFLPFFLSFSSILVWSNFHLLFVEGLHWI